MICSAFSIGVLCQSSTDMKRKTADIASFFSKGAVRKKKPAEAQNDRQGEQTDETDSESEREECPVSGVVPRQLPGIQTLSHMHLAIVLPSLTMSKKVRYTEYYLIFSTITCIPNIVEVCGLGALITPIYSSETLPPQNDQ